MHTLLKRTSVAVLIVIAVVAVFGGGFSLGFELGRERPKTVQVEGVSNIATPGDVDADMGVFWQAWDVLKGNFLNDEAVSSEERVYGAVRGLVGALDDPYSSFFDPPDSQKFQEDIEGNFSGIGAEIGIRSNQLLIIAPLKNSPAAGAGLKAGDRVFAINGSSTEGIAIDEAVRHIRGPEGTPVVLNVFRDGWEKPKDIEIIRAAIVAPTLEYEMKEGGIVHVELYSFNANANRLFYAAVFDALSRGARGMVLDLRDNPGGYLEVSVDLAGWFLPRGTIVVTEASREGVIEEFRANGNAALQDFPVIVLVNAGSASASEILAGTLRDNRHVLLVGETTFGKGTVQQIFPLKDDSSLKVTVAHWVLPSGRTLESEGLKPDYEVLIDEEDAKTEKDPQLEKALELLRKTL